MGLRVIVSLWNLTSARQQRCRGTCQISEWSDHYKSISYSFENLGDLMVGCLMAYWILMGWCKRDSYTSAIQSYNSMFLYTTVYEILWEGLEKFLVNMASDMSANTLISFITRSSTHYIDIAECSYVLGPFQNLIRYILVGSHSLQTGQ